MGAKMVPFGGFEMPIQYTNITDEHQAVRNACGVFDVSHMGEVLVTGKQAEAFVQHIFTNDVAGAPVGKIFYGMMLRPSGGTVDDLLVYKMGDECFFLVINVLLLACSQNHGRENGKQYEFEISHNYILFC